MKRPILVWVTFIACLGVVLTTLGWVSKRVIDVEASDAQARARADHEEAVRLAQWRMTGALSLLAHRESARPYFAYQPFYAPDQAYTKMFEPIDQTRGEVLLPSRLLVLEFVEVLLHFQIAPDGTVSSPQVPTGNMRDLAESRGFTSGDRITRAEQARDRVAEVLGDGTKASGLAMLRSRLPAPADPPPVVQVEQEPLQCMPMVQTEAPRDPDVIEGPVQAQTSEQKRTRGNWRQQDVRNVQEFEARNAQTTQILGFNNDANFMYQNGFPTQFAGISEGLMQGVWVEGELLFARRVLVDGQEYLQGCWLDWPRVKESLLTTCEDLFPQADLVPTTGLSDEHRVSFLPVDLVPGATSTEPVEEMTSLEWFLLVAWSAGLLATAAVLVLLVGALGLSERRRRFVSAVTHELRTPLTTFRMYTEMLASGMVKGKDKESEYLKKLHLEAERLGHLVENVLTYARLEAGRDRATLEARSVRELLDDVGTRLVERAEQAGFELSVRTADKLPAVRTDAGALERILFNLVDNACKYGRGQPPQLEIHALAAGNQVEIQVSDNGPGVDSSKVGSLFRAFSKSAGTTTSESPGVGLGLSLSRRLARDMGGDLSLDTTYTDGARFVVSLPRA